MSAERVQKKRADERTRTADLLITSLNRAVSARTGVSDDCASLQVILMILGVSLSRTYRSVLARLRYGCGKLLDRADVKSGLLFALPPLRGRFPLE